MIMTFFRVFFSFASIWPLQEQFHFRRLYFQRSLNHKKDIMFFQKKINFLESSLDPLKKRLVTTDLDYI